jgi:putative ABC transport system permease protein
VILGYGLAANLGVSLGETVVLLVNKPGGGVNAVEAKVRGLFATISKAYDDSAMRVPFALATRLLGEEGAHRWIVYLDDTAQTSAALAAFRERFAASGLEFVPWFQLADFYHKTVRLLSRQMAVVQLIIALIIVLTISNAMMMAVRERTSEIGTSMALGTRKRAVLVQFLLEGGLIGIVGGALGVAVGIGLAGLISAIGIPMPPPPGQSQAYRAEMIVTAPASIVAFVLAVMTTLGAALYPAWRASRLRIVDALRHNR